MLRDIEEIGFDVAYVGDHLTHPSLAWRWLADGWTTLAAAATVTERLELGTLVSSAAVRSPVPLAGAAVTVNDISGGRVVLGWVPAPPRTVRLTAATLRTSAT